ncbi:hypothetical protein DFR70_13313 [Nocardia tenerifensis]|uniref:Uncharacterized protein n=1 Tax=Nocardia tenerifensis TaxID=228006 RepID=A0A318JL61_9NOCA|nr:hypothetical protein DFR70_13313 [Nocardia tenerifensis]
MHVRERVVTHETEILVPRTPDDAVALVLSDRDATVALLAELRRRIATTPITTDLERVTVRLVRQELTELTSACQRALADYAAPQSGTPVARLAGADLAPGLQRAERRRRKRTR